MTALERAVAHGNLRASVKDYWSKRERTLSAGQPVRRRPNDIAKLQADMTSMGGGIVAGPSPDGPVH